MSPENPHSEEINKPEVLSHDQLLLQLENSEIKLSWTNDGYKYIINYSDGRVGLLEVVYQKLHSRSGTEEYDYLIQQGLDPEDTIVHLNRFYPNGRWSINEKNTEYMRTGTGSKALEFLMQKAILKNAKGMFVFTTTESIERFLLKHGFTEVGKNRFAKVISH